MVSSVKILDLMVNFGVFEEFKMLDSFLRCFPNVDTLHIQQHHKSEGEGSKQV